MKSADVRSNKLTRIDKESGSKRAAESGAKGLDHPDRKARPAGETAEVCGAPAGADNVPELAPETTIAAASVPNADQMKRLEEIPPRQRPVFLRAWRGNSRKAALRAFCLECMGYESAEVNRCTARACPLYPYRGDRL